jgi:hypothetical protein
MILDWLSRKFDNGPFNHTYKDGWLSWNISNNDLTIRLDFNVTEQFELFKKIPESFKGKSLEGNLVNAEVLYFDVETEFKVEYPEILGANISDKYKYHDELGEPYYIYDWWVKLSDGSQILYTNKSEVIDMDDQTYRTKIQERAFHKSLEDATK